MNAQGCRDDDTQLAPPLRAWMRGVHKLLKEYPDYSLTTVDVSSYPSVTEVPWFGGKVVCAKMRGARSAHRRVAKLEEKLGSIDDWSGRPAMPSGEE
jgi:hypothetical protein